MQCSVAHQLDLFGGHERLPRRPYCSDDLSYGLKIRSLEQALTKPYIQVNPPHLRIWSIYDCDYPGAGLAWEDASLPPPSWSTVNKENGHAHLVWGLSAPVLVDSLKARDSAMRYLAAVEEAMRVRLRADPGYSGLITKNPVHPMWRTLRGPVLGYDLRELAEYIPDVELFKPKRKRSEEVGVGRNVSLFDITRKWAYKAIRDYWGGGLHGWNAFLDATYRTALGYNGEFFYPLDEREVWHIARSIVRWTWKMFNPDKFNAIQSARGSRLKRNTRELEAWLQNTL